MSESGPTVPAAVRPRKKAASIGDREIIGDRLSQLATQTSEVIRRTAHSHIAREAGDLTATLHLPSGDVIAQAMNAIPIHLCGASTFLRSFLERRPIDSWEPHTLLVSNDPYAGGQHLPDISVVAPFFFGGELRMFIIAMLHHTDVGGATVGGIVGNATDIFSTGLRIPIIELTPDFRELLAANVRVPYTVLSDLDAQLAGLEFCKRRLTEVYERYGVETINDACSWLLEYSERRVRQALESMPDGSFSVVECIDDDGQNLGVPVPIQVSVEKKGSDLTVDFAGSATQTGTMNSPLTSTIASVNLSLRQFFDADIPNNEGCTVPIHIVAERGSINNPMPPAGVNPRATVCHRQEEAIIGGMAYLDPENCRAASYGCSPSFNVYGIGDDGARFVLVAGTIPGGMGARPGLDGVDAVCCDLSNTRYINLETVEQTIPLLYHSQTLRADSGGPGKYRGGASACQVVEALLPMTLTLFSDRQEIPAFGLFGGHAGDVAEYAIRKSTGERIKLHSKATNVKLEKGDVLIFSPAGGGGYGSPLERPADAVCMDVRRNIVSRVAAGRDYGVIFADGTDEVDQAATAAARAQRASEAEPGNYVIDRGVVGAEYTKLPRFV